MAESHRDEITKLEALYSDNPEGRVFTLLAEAYRKAGELDHAREVLEGGIKRHTAYASAYVVLGRVLLDQQLGPAAEDAFKRVLELDPENLVALRALGDRARTTGRQQEAIKYYRELLMLDPSDEELQQTVATLQNEITAQAAAISAQPTALDQGGWNPAAAEAAGARDSQIASGDFGNISIDSGGLTLPETANFGDISMQSGSGNMLSLEPDAPAQDLGSSFSLDTSDTAFTGLGGGLGSTDLGAGPSDGGVSSGEYGTLPDFGGFSLDQGEVDLGGLSDASFDPGEAGNAQDTRDTIGLPPLSFEPLEEASVGATDLPLLDGPPTPAMPADTLSWSPEPVDMLDTPAAAESHSDTSFRPFAPAADEPAAFPFTTDGVVQETSPSLEGWSPEELTSDAPALGAAPAAPQSEPVRAPEPAVDDSPWAAPVEAPPPELATETMAELYMSQGLHARAVEVYRALLRERPDDERLYAKLRTAEFAISSALMAQQPPQAPQSQTAALPQVEEEIEPVSAWTVAPSTAGQEETPYAWADEEEPDAGPQIGAYFSSLLAWRSASPRPKGAEPAQAAAPEQAVSAPPLAAPAQQRQSPAAAAAEAETDLSWLDEPEAPAPAAPTPAHVAAPTPVAKPAAAATPEDDLAWLFEDEAAAAATPSPEASSKQESASEPEGGGGDDDDLEMFRAWLSSLKR